MYQANLFDRGSYWLEEKPSEGSGGNPVPLLTLKTRSDCKTCTAAITKRAIRKHTGTPGDQLDQFSFPLQRLCATDDRKCDDRVLQTSPGQASGQHTEDLILRVCDSILGFCDFGSYMAGSTQTFITLTQHCCGQTFCWICIPINLAYISAVCHCWIVFSWLM